MLDKKYNFKDNDAKWENFWQENNIFKFHDNSGKKIYAIDTPPPTVNGAIHMGHISSYIHIDALARHHKKLGEEVYFPFGFDDNGLPTERYVEKKNKIHANQLSRKEFTDLCLKETQALEKEFANLYKSIGYSANLSECYSTISDSSRAISQKSFIELYNKGDIYRNYGASLWCSECRTAIAQSELDTVEIESTLNYLYFQVENSDDKLVIATSRPEMLCGCDCLFINPNDERFKKYIGKNAIVPIYHNVVPILANEDALMDKGSGIVMCCTYGDEADMKWQKEFNLEVKNCIGPDGRMTELAKQFAGMKVVEARKAIIEELKAQNDFIKDEKLVHMVSTHERCGNPVEIIAKNQWFIKILDKKQELLEKVNQIKWHPDGMKVRLINWIEGLKWDWCISRQRFYGVPFPVWYCKKCGAIHVADINELPVDPTLTQLNCTCKCGCSEWLPETDVMDTWATSSLTPQLATNVKFNSGLSNKCLPYSLRPNAHDNIRVWDFYTIIKSMLHFNCLPWTDIAVSGFIKSKDNEKLSKSKSNGADTPQSILTQWSPDVTRYWACSATLGKDRLMNYEDFDSGKKLSNKLWNVAKFAYMFLEGYTLDNSTPFYSVDAFYVNKYFEQRKKFMEKLEDCEIGTGLKDLEAFFWDFCDNYIEIAKFRLYRPEIYGEQAKRSALRTLYIILLGMLEQFSLYLPHITEEIFHGYFSEQLNVKSLYLLEYSKVVEAKNDNADQCATMVDVLGEVRKYKSVNNLSLKDEIAELKLYGYTKFDKDIEDDFLAASTVQKIEYIPSNEKKIEIVK